MGTVYRHYNNDEANSALGGYTASDVFRVEFSGNTVNWLKNGVVLSTETESSISYPLNVVAILHNEISSCSAVEDLAVVT